MSKTTLYGHEARTAILKGVKKIASAVKCTLGPLGRNVLISRVEVINYNMVHLPVRVTKDGYTVTQNFDVDDPLEKPGVLLLKEAAQKSVDQSGDGTTTTIVLAEAIFRHAVELMEKKSINPIQLKREIDQAVDYVVKELDKMAIPARNNIQRIREIATVSANNDTFIGNTIAMAFEKIGDEGIIDIEASKSVETDIKISDGYKFDRGWLGHFFVTNKARQSCEFENPLILFYDKKVTHYTQIQAACEIAVTLSRSLLIICEDCVENGMAFLVQNVWQNRMKACAVRSPSFGEDRTMQMEDMALLTGGAYVSDLRGIEVKEVQLSHLGQAKKVIITRDETIIIEGNSDKNKIEDKLNDLRMDLAAAKNENEKYPIEKRIARFQGGVATIQVGATTETEMKERMDRFDDAIRATKSAIAEGYVAGGGTVFAQLSVGNKTDGDVIISKALEEPLKQICENAGADAIAILREVKLSADHVGYNARAERIENLLQAGIIDPKKVLRTALQNGASAATMMITAEVLYAESM